MYDRLKKTLFTLSCAVYLCVAQNVAAQTQPESPDYSAGMSAYMANDFEAAQNYWQRAAQANDGRAMFNLGLLHERQKVAGASAETADQWFQRAGNAGYAAADYHLALRREAMGMASEADGLFKRAAAGGYFLAQERLGIVSSQVPDSAATSSQASVSQGQPNRPTQAYGGAVVPSVSQQSALPSASTSPQPSPQNTARTYQRENWLLQQVAEHWTIQMLAFSDEAKVRNFIDDHGLHRNAAYFAERRGDAVIYKLVYGAYPSKEAADSARSGFTAALKEHGPWLRPLRAVQAVINQP